MSRDLFDGWDDHRPRRKPDRCLDCRNPITWAEQRRQFGRLVKKKRFRPAQAKAVLPRCQKCLTRYLREHPDPPMIGGTVHAELLFRGGCRYGLKGVRVSVANHSGVFVVDWSDWGQGHWEHDLRLCLIPESAWDAYIEREGNDGIRVMSAAQLMDWEPDYPAGTLRNVDARDCILVSEWPVVCCPRGEIPEASE